MLLRITVLKRAAFEDLIEAYVPQGRKVSYGPCDRFEDRQVFDVRGGSRHQASVLERGPACSATWLSSSWEATHRGSTARGP